MHSQRSTVLLVCLTKDWLINGKLEIYHFFSGHKIERPPFSVFHLKNIAHQLQKSCTA